jgi:hypothetical protein
VNALGETETLSEGVGVSEKPKLLSAEGSFDTCWFFEGAGDCNFVGTAFLLVDGNSVPLVLRLTEVDVDKD